MLWRSSKAWGPTWDGLEPQENELVKFDKEPDALPPECERFYRNFTLLGAPIGDEQFCTDYITTFTRKRVRHAHSALRGIRDPQVFHFLVRCCASLSKWCIYFLWAGTVVF